MPQVVGTDELLPATAHVHVALLDHQLHVPQPANPAAGLSELHIIWRIFTQHVHKSVRQPLQFVTRSDVANNRVIIMRSVKWRSLVLYTCLVADIEVPSMTLKNSKASNSYSSEAERRWLLPPISDKQQKRPISTLTTDHKTCMITGISRKYPICPIFSKVMLKFMENFSMTFAEK